VSIARAIAAALLVTALSACNTTPEGTPYQPVASDYRPYGYAERKLENGDWEVRFTADKHTAREDAETSALKRAAELTLKAGLKKFAVLDRVWEKYVDTQIEREIVISDGNRTVRRTERNFPRKFVRERRIAIYSIRPYRGEAPKGAVRTYDAKSILKQ